MFRPISAALGRRGNSLNALGSIFDDAVSFVKSPTGEAIVGGVTSLIQNPAGEAIRRIQLETAYGPTIIVDHPLEERELTAEEAASDPSRVIMRILKPKLTIDTILGTKIAMPYGEPGPTAWPTVKWLLIFGTAALAVVAVYTVRKL